jgi:hypothetical protein
MPDSRLLSRWVSAVSLGSALALAAGCESTTPPGGDGGPGPLPGDDVPTPLDKRYLPLAMGLTWTYRVIDGGIASMKTQVVEALEAPPVDSKKSVKAFRVKTTKGANDHTVSWQEPIGNILARHLEQSFAPGSTTPSLTEWWEPYKIRLDMRPSRLQAGVVFNVTYTEYNQVAGGQVTMTVRNEKWSILSTTEPVMAMGMMFKDVLMVRRQGTDAGAASDKTYWYARGVGKLKEVGGQTEDLMAFSGLPPM